MSAIVLNRSEIENRVRNGGNSFTKEEIVAYRDIIREVRAEKKKWLASLGEEQQLDIVRAAIRKGFQLEATSMKELKNCDKFSPVFVRRDETVTLRNKAERLAAELAKVQAAIQNAQAVAA